ncbi:MAG: glycosyltransferase [Desulfobacteraceae bacterium]|nr:glycosyltransferase [Desulfobacteraceae bacterium]
MIISKIKNEIKHRIDWAVKIRNSKIWPLIRPFYQIAARFIHFDPLLGVQSKVLKDHRLRLYNLGFTEKTLSELQRLVDDNIFQASAAWELALWHANQYTPENAEKALKFLKIAGIGKHDPARIRAMAVLKSECRDITGDRKTGRSEIKRALRHAFHPDLCLAASNLEHGPDARIRRINQAFAFYHLSPISVMPSPDKPFFDSLTPATPPQLSPSPKNVSANIPLVTVIMPVFNAEKTIATAIGSLLSQTWKHLEIIIVDDCSTDDTTRQIDEYIKKDSRISRIKAEVNAGAYVARNLGLQRATGEFVTCHDADDWSHPQKIGMHVQHLIDHPTIVANISQLARCGNNLKFFRRGNPGNYIQINMSSIMFRRIPIMEKIGYWDSVRFGADGEFLRRLKKIFSEKKIVALNTGPVSLIRQSRKSLTGNQYFGYPGFFMGARKEYRESHDHHHENAKNLFFAFPQKKRPFPAPVPMLPQPPSGNEKNHFDVIMVSDFRLPGGTTASNIEEIKAQRELGLRTGLVQMSRYDLIPSRTTHPGIRDLTDGEQVRFIVYGENATCDMLVLRHPTILQERQRYIPDITAKTIRVIINQTPLQLYDKNGRVYYDFKTCATNLEYYFAHQGYWHPIGPLVRKTLTTHHAEDLKHIRLSETDWYNIIDVPNWRRNGCPPKRDKIIIGRHSRDDRVKWPATADELLTIYPASDDYEMNILGGAQIPQKVIGYLPKNWRVYEFGAMHPKEFLSRLHVFVYYTHPDWVESFGRVIFEAMATGVPVVVHPMYRDLFAEAAIYADPEDVQRKIKQLMDDMQYYDRQVKTAHDYVEEHFGYSRHIQRIRPMSG